MKIRITLTEAMLGTVPKDKKVYTTYIADKVEKEVGEEEAKSVEEIEAKGWTGFHKDEGGLFVFDYLVKGFIKEAGNTLKDIVKIKALKSKLDNYLFVFPRKIHLGKSKPDGVIERPLRAMTAQGPRVTLMRSDMVEAGVSFDVELRLLPHKEITESVLEELLRYGELKGLGQFRNGSYGRFTFERLADDAAIAA